MKTRLQHLWLAIVGERSVESGHVHTDACTPDNCDLSVGDYLKRAERAADLRTMEQLREALKPLAHMHIQNAPPEYILCERSTGERGRGVRFMLTMAHASRAFYLLDDHSI